MESSIIHIGCSSYSSIVVIVLPLLLLLFLIWLLLLLWRYNCDWGNWMWCCLRCMTQKRTEFVCCLSNESSSFQFTGIVYCCCWNWPCFVIVVVTCCFEENYHQKITEFVCCASKLIRQLNWISNIQRQKIQNSNLLWVPFWVKNSVLVPKQDWKSKRD